MNLSYLLLYSKIEKLGYDTIYLEKPVSNIVDFDWKNILETQPKNTDRTTINELRYLSSLTSKRSRSEVELIHSIDQELDLPFIKIMDTYNIEYPQNFIDLFYDIIRPIILNIKGLYNRPRPIQLAELYNIDIDVIPTDTTHTASYPSGHTVYSSLVANIIKYYYPKIDNKKLDNIVKTTSRARMLQGVHYPSDNNASLILSKFLFDNINNKIRKYKNDTI